MKAFDKIKALFAKSTPEPDLVESCFGCPQCGNQDMSSLSFNEYGDIVTCTLCGTEYDPMTSCVVSYLWPR